MTKRSVLLLSLIAVLIFSWTAFAAKDPSEITIVMIVKQSDPWFDDMERGINQFREDFGVNAYTLVPESGDPALQIAIMENLIAQQVDAITIVPNDPQAMIPVIRKAREAGIVVVTHEAPDIAEHVDLDLEAFRNEDFGVLMGKSLAEKMGGKGKYAGFVGGLTMTTHMEWYKAAVQYIEENYPEMVNISKEPFVDENNLQVAYNRALEILRVHPDIRGFFDCSAHGAGIAQALRERGRSEDVVVASLAIPSMSATFLKDGSMDHGQAWRPADAGYATVYAAYKLVVGEEVTTGTDLKAPGYEDIIVEGKIAYGYAPLVITAENVDDFEF